MKKGKVQNELVPLVKGTIQNQPCIYGELVESHSVYCDNDESPYRKCHCSWYYGRATSIIDKCADEDCEYFKANPDYSEDKLALTNEIKQEQQERVNAKLKNDKLISEGWLCPNCYESLGYNDKTTLCACGTLVTGVVEFRLDKKYTDAEIALHFEQDPIDVPMRKKCQCFHIRERYTAKRCSQEVMELKI